MEGDNIMDVNEVRDRKISFTDEEAARIRAAVKRIQDEVLNELNKSKDRKETNGRSK